MTIVVLSAYKIKKENTKPIKPLTSTKLKPINAHLTNKLVIAGFLDNPIINAAKIVPTPIATPKNDKIGILQAKYLKPNKIISIQPHISSKLTRHT